VLDVMNSRAVAIGWIFLTIALAVGFVWSSQARSLAPDNSNLQRMALNDPKIFFATLSWALYSFAVLSRRTMGWTGRRSAWLSALGFAIILLNFLPVSYFVTTSHTFE
jgi:ABC-type transport system involved in cytochrome c biogenesis permease subunit